MSNAANLSYNISGVPKSCCSRSWTDHGCSRIHNIEFGQQVSSFALSFLTETKVSWSDLCSYLPGLLEPLLERVQNDFLCSILVWLSKSDLFNRPRLYTSERECFWSICVMAPQRVPLCTSPSSNMGSRLHEWKRSTNNSNRWPEPNIAFIEVFGFFTPQWAEANKWPNDSFVFLPKVWYLCSLQVDIRY